MEDLFSSRYPCYRYARPNSISAPSSSVFSNTDAIPQISRDFCKTQTNSKSESIPIRERKFIRTETDKAITTSLKEKVLRILDFKKKDGKYQTRFLNKLPGPMPRTLTRKNLHLFRSESFWISEKSDGERFILYITKNATYLIDRSFEFHQIRSDFYSSNFGQKGDSLMDGELILRSENSKNKIESNYKFLENRPIFLIFDIILLYGITVYSDNLCKRFSHIGKFNTHYREKARTKEHPIAILAKLFFPLKKLNHLCSFVSFDPSRNCYHFKDKRKGLINLNDGFIFTPQNDTFLQEKKMLYKWKWPTLNSLDFRVNFPFFEPKSNHLDLYCTWHEDEMILLKKLGPFSAKDKNILLKELKQSRKKFCVVECSLLMNSFGKIVWKVQKIRFDRDIPNHISTMIRTMEVLADEVTLAEIKGLTS